MVAWYCILQNKMLNAKYASSAHNIYYENKRKVNRLTGVLKRQLRHAVTTRSCTLAMDSYFILQVTLWQNHPIILVSCNNMAIIFQAR
jgi:hypothetical protein